MDLAVDLRGAQAYTIRIPLKYYLQSYCSYFQMTIALYHDKMQEFDLHMPHQHQVFQCSFHTTRKNGRQFLFLLQGTGR